MHAAQQKSRKNIKYRKGFLYFRSLNKWGRLILPRTFNIERIYFVAFAIVEAYLANAQSRIKKTIIVAIDKFKYLCFVWLFKQYIGSYNIWE